MKSHRPYKLEEYNPEWKEIFQEVSTKVKNILGDIVVEAQHIGSTSVEGMIAKPQVDILVVVKDIELVKSKHEEMIGAGFTHHGRGYVNEDDDYFSLNAEDGRRIASIHILQEGNFRIADYIVFRDYLRAHPGEGDLYISTKKDLYSKHSDNYADYDKGKSDVVLAIRERARKWFGDRVNN